MKLVTANGKQSIKISKTEWLALGKKMGWSAKVAMNNKIDINEALKNIDAPPQLKTFVAQQIRRLPDVAGSLLEFFSLLLQQRVNLANLFNFLDENGIQDVALKDIFNKLPRKLIVAFRESSGNQTHKELIWQVLLHTNRLEDKNTMNIQKIKAMIKSIQQVLATQGAEVAEEAVVGEGEVA